MKKILLTSLILLLSACDSNTTEKLNKNLPWQVSTTQGGATHVLGVDIGNITFKQLMFKLQLLAEPALFEAADGSLTLEAYFGKKKFGVLEARLIAEMDADEKLLKTMLKEQMGKDSTPSNHWKYALSVKNTRLANDLRVWRLVYLPVADYDLKQMKFFGEPEEILKINNTAEYWLYPDKGMALLYDSDGKEIFYYAAPKDYQRLRKSLPMKRQIISH
jgi:hypothetical protein